MLQKDPNKRPPIELILKQLSYVEDKSQMFENLGTFEGFLTSKNESFNPQTLIKY